MKKCLPFLILLAACSPRQEAISPVRKNLIESVYSSVTIQPDSAYKAYSAVVAIVDKNLVEEGSLVKQGTPLLKLRDLKPVLQEKNARLNLELALTNEKGNNKLLNSLAREIKATRLNFYNDSINYLRQKNLWDQNIGSKIEFENRKLAYEISKHNLQLLEQEYNSTLQELKNLSVQAYNSYKASLFDVNEFTVTSTIDGKVYALYKEPGELVTTIEPVAFIGSAENFIIELMVDETDIVKIEPGQKVLVNLDAYENKVFEARIKKIYPTKEERTQTFKIEAVFTKTQPKLYPGLVGEANIIISEKTNALVIPREYLVSPTQVLTRDSLIDIVTGIQDMEYIEVISGLEESDKLLKPER